MVCGWTCRGLSWLSHYPAAPCHCARVCVFVLNTHTHCVEGSYRVILHCPSLTHLAFSYLFFHLFQGPSITHPRRFLSLFYRHFCLFTCVYLPPTPHIYLLEYVSQMRDWKQIPLTLSFIFKLIPLCSCCFWNALGIKCALWNAWELKSVA